MERKGRGERRDDGAETREVEGEEMEKLGRVEHIEV